MESPTTLIFGVAVMTWPDVASDALKIIVPSGMAAIAAVSVAVFAHLNTRDKERRERRLKVLEASLEDLMRLRESVRALEYLVHLASTLRADQKSEQAEQTQWMDTWDEYKARDDSAPEILTVRSRLMMHGFDDCADLISKLPELHSRTMAALSNRRDVPVTSEFAEQFGDESRLLFSSAISSFLAAHEAVEREGWIEGAKLRWQQAFRL